MSEYENRYQSYDGSSTSSFSRGGQYSDRTGREQRAQANTSRDNRAQGNYSGNTQGYGAQGGYAQGYGGGQGYGSGQSYGGGQGYGATQGVYSQEYGGQGYGTQAGYNQGYGSAQGSYYQGDTSDYDTRAYPPSYQSRQTDNGYVQNGAAAHPTRVQYDPNSRNRANHNAGPNQPKEGNGKKILGLFILIALIAILIALGVFIYIRMTTINVSVNGQQIELRSGTKAVTLIDEGYASPAPGNLLAVDGTVITPGGGTEYTITIDGNRATGDTELTGDSLVIVGNGEDVTESFTTTQETIAAQPRVDATDFGSYWNGSLHLLTDSVDGVMNVKTGDISGVTVREVATPAVDGGYINYTASPSQMVIALTFDDGPWPESTAAILDILEQYGAKATFFTIGSQLSGYEQTVARMQSLGCQVLTHTYDHAAGSGQGVNITYMSSDEQIWEVTQGYAAIAAITGQEPAHIFRAPGGNFYGETIWTLWPYVDAEIGWDVDTMDWSRPGADSIASSILSAQSGQVILMHDGGGDRSQTVEALRQALPILIERGYTFVTVSELIEMSK